MVPAVHTLAELKLSGNHLKGSRPVLSFHKVQSGFKLIACGPQVPQLVLLSSCVLACKSWLSCCQAVCAYADVRYWKAASVRMPETAVLFRNLTRSRTCKC